MQFEFLITTQTQYRGRALILALFEGAKRMGLRASQVSTALNPKAVLVLYGMGAADRMDLAAKHLRNGGRVISWDAGYWERTLSESARKYRVSIDGFHAPALVMRGPRPSVKRWASSGLPITDAPRRDNGYLLLIGNGPKSNAAYSMGWSVDKSQQLRAAFPGREIVYRPKPKRPAEKGVTCDRVSLGDIGAALLGCSLVVCRHSNVAVDACMRGVPVVCDDGAAAAIFPRHLVDFEQQPDRATREEFLHRLAYWQWSPNECARGDVWPWLLEKLKT